MKYIAYALIGFVLFTACTKSTEKTDTILKSVFVDFKDVQSSKTLSKKETKAELIKILGKEKMAAYGSIFESGQIQAQLLILSLAEKAEVLVIQQSCKLYFIGDTPKIFQLDAGDDDTKDGGTVNVTCCTYPETCTVNCVPGDCANACDACNCECGPDGEGEDDEILDFI